MKVTKRTMVTIEMTEMEAILLAIALGRVSNLDNEQDFPHSPIDLQDITNLENMLYQEWDSSVATKLYDAFSLTKYRGKRLLRYLGEPPLENLT